MTLLPRSVFAAQVDGLIAKLRQYVEIESPSNAKPALDRLGALIAGDLRALGAEVEVHRQTKAGDHVVGRWNVSASAPAGILLMCHIDTVYPVGTLAKHPVQVKAGKFYGPGAYDMKASSAMLLSAIDQLRRTGALPERPITALFTSDEEVGSHTSRALIETLARQHALVLCLEPALPDGSLKTWRKGIGDFRLRVTGRAAHAGADHERGVNAVEELAHHVLALQQLTDYTRGTTVNVGVIRGGTRTNVVPAEATAQGDFRVMTEAEADRVSALILGRKPVHPDATLTVTGGLNRPPMPRTPLIMETFQRAQAIAERLGLTIGEGGTGGGSDANFVAPLGVRVLDGLGAMGNGAHSEHEHVLIASLPERTALLAGILSEWD